MKKIRKSTITILALSMLFSAPLVACGGGTTSNPNVTSQIDSSEKTVSGLTVKTKPTKLNYYVGEEFDGTGCVITMKFSDNTTEDVDLTDSRLNVTLPDTSTAGSKNVIVKSGNARVTIQIKVEVQKYVITFDLNYAGSTATTVEVEKGNKVTKPTDPSREGFEFAGWYTDQTFNTEYNFDLEVTSAFTLYAQWLDNSKKSYNFTFDLNYYGVKQQTTISKIEEGNKAIKPTDPVRKGYVFDNWYLDAAFTNLYNFDSIVSENTTVYAKWNRSETEYTGEQTYIFEAEDVSLKGMTGKGLSGTVTETGLIVSDDNVEASNGRFISYLYKMGLQLKFYITSDVAVDNVSFSMRLAAEVEDLTVSKDMFSVMVNGNDQDYAPISITNVPASTAAVPYSQFKDYVVNSSLSLNKGKNTIVLSVINNTPYVGSTMEAHAPMVDCLKLTTNNAVLDWDGVKDLPANNYKK